MIAALYLPLLLSASALLISIVSFLFFKSYLKNRTGQERILAEFRQEVNTILKSIDETTDRDISLLEDREKRLKSLLADVDKRLTLYIREMERYGKTEKARAALPVMEKKPEAAYAALGKKRYKGFIPEDGAPDDAPSGVLKAEPKPEAAMPTKTETGGTSIEAKSASPSSQIRFLMRSGLTDANIASRLGISIAEVEFVAALLERRDGNSLHERESDSNTDKHDGNGG